MKLCNHSSVLVCSRNGKFLSSGRSKLARNLIVNWYSIFLFRVQCSITLTALYIWIKKDRWGHFNFTNSEFHLREFTILTSWIHVFNIQISRIVYSRSWFYKFVKIKSWFREVEIVKFMKVEFMKLKSWIREVEIVKFTKVKIVNWERWNREFINLKCPQRSLVLNSFHKTSLWLVSIPLTEFLYRSFFISIYTILTYGDPLGPSRDTHN
jgi:hypothetical protein